MKKRILIRVAAFALVTSTLFAQDVVLSSRTPEERERSESFYGYG